MRMRWAMGLGLLAAASWPGGAQGADRAARVSAGTLGQFYFGNPGDYGFMGDWDCDGVDTPGLYRQSDGYAYLRNSNTQGVADVAFFFGNPGDVPMAVKTAKAASGVPT